MCNDTHRGITFIAKAKHVTSLRRCVKAYRPPGAAKAQEEWLAASGAKQHELKMRTQRPVKPRSSIQRMRASATSDVAQSVSKVRCKGRLASPSVILPPGSRVQHRPGVGNLSRAVVGRSRALVLARSLHGSRVSWLGPSGAMGVQWELMLGCSTEACNGARLVA